MSFVCKGKKQKKEREKKKTNEHFLFPSTDGSEESLQRFVYMFFLCRREALRSCCVSTNSFPCHKKASLDSSSWRDAVGAVSAFPQHHSLPTPPLLCFINSSLALPCFALPTPPCCALTPQSLPCLALPIPPLPCLALPAPHLQGLSLPTHASHAQRDERGVLQSG